MRRGTGGLGAVKGLGGAGGCSQGRHTVSMLVAKSIRSRVGSLLRAAPAHAKHVGPSSALAANSVSRKWMTATLRFDLHHSIAGTPHLDHPHTPVEHRKHVRAVPRPRHHEAPMAPALDQAPLRLTYSPNCNSYSFRHSSQELRCSRDSCVHLCSSRLQCWLDINSHDCSWHRHY